ncbi:MAG: hypothetical protein IKD72_07210 [Clostridia bacterium]|nr:hypothetical protein [Clostridia bacterium]
MKKRLITLFSVIAALAVFAVVLFTVLLPRHTQRQLNALLEAGQYAQAAAFLSEKDRNGTLRKTVYDKALQAEAAGDHKRALALFELIPYFQDTQTQITAVQKRLSEAFLDGITPGSFARFGHYEQDGDEANGKEPIDWRVLAKKNGSLLLLSASILDARPFADAEETPQWRTSGIRSWLATAFLPAAFSDAEQAAILPTDVEQDGLHTSDPVFLLSYEEIKTYLQFDGRYFCEPTAYAVTQIPENRRYLRNQWWLRTPDNGTYFGMDMNKILYAVDLLGAADADQIRGVRPALWISAETAARADCISASDVQPKIPTDAERAENVRLFWEKTSGNSPFPVDRSVDTEEKRQADRMMQAYYAAEKKDLDPDVLTAETYEHFIFVGAEAAPSDSNWYSGLYWYIDQYSFPTADSNETLYYVNVKSDQILTGYLGSSNYPCWSHGRSYSEWRPLAIQAVRNFFPDYEEANLDVDIFYPEAIYVVPDETYDFCFRVSFDMTSVSIVSGDVLGHP